MNRLMLLSLTIVGLLAVPASAAIVPVELFLVPPSGQTNTFDLTGTATAFGITASASETVTLTGSALANLTIDFQPVTQEANTIGLEFTGGRIASSDLSFTISVTGYPPGTINIDVTGEGLAGTPDTPSPPGGVSGGAFAASDHIAVLNEGTVTIDTDYFTHTINFADHPFITTTDETGSLTVSSPTIIGHMATYDVTIMIPVSFDDYLVDGADFDVSVAGGGTFLAEGQFTIPEPATLSLLAVGGLVLIRRRRR